MRGVLSVPALLLGCASAALAQVPHFPEMAGSTFNVPVASLQEIRLTGTVLQQYDFSCGSAALATLLTHHYGHPVSEQVVLQEMYAYGDQQKIQKEGFSLLDMKRYLNTLGFTADGFQQPIDKLLEAHIPAVALVNESGYHHFVVLKGLDKERVLIGDPAKGTRALTRKEFEAIWLNGLLFVIHNRMNQALFNQPDDWRAAPQAPLIAGKLVNGMGGVDLRALGPGDF